MQLLMENKCNLYLCKATSRVYFYERKVSQDAFFRGGYNGIRRIGVTATCVHVPVINGHSESIYVELISDYDLEEVKLLLADAPGITLVDDPVHQPYPLATESAGKPDVFVGRLGRDLVHEKGLNLWVVSDNLQNGTAWNAVQIAKIIASERLSNA